MHNHVSKWKKFRVAFICQQSIWGVVVVMRNNPSISHAVLRHTQPNQALLATSRSSWFPPFVGTLLTLYAMIDSAVEGTNIPMFALLVIGVSLICYRLWPASAKARLGFLWWEFLISIGCMVAQVLPFVISNETLTMWVGNKSIAGLVLDSIAILLLFWLSSNNLFASLHGPSKIKFWRAPTVLQIAVHITCISFASMFNPSILLFPFFLILIVSLSQLSSGVAVDRLLIGKEAFPSIALGYLVTCIIGGYILCLPVIRDHVNSSTDWLPELLGIPRIGSGDSGRNLSCVLPSLISLLVMFVMLPWWCHVTHKPVAPSRTDTRRQTTLFPEISSSVRHRATLDGASPDRNIVSNRLISRGLSVVGEHVINDDNDLLAMSTPIMTSDVSPNAAFRDNESAAEEEDKKRKRQLIFRRIRSIFGNFLLPIGFILSGLFLPSSLSITLVVIGSCMIALSSRLIVGKFRFLVQLYMSIFASAVFIVGFLWQVCPDSSTFVLSGIGVMIRDRDIWTRFLSLMSLILLIISWSLISRFWASEPPLPIEERDGQVDRLEQVIENLKQAKDESSFTELMRRVHLAANQDSVLTSDAFRYLVFGSVVDYKNLRRLLLVDAVDRSVQDDASKAHRRRTLIYESIVGIFQSCEMTVSLILVVLISTCAILHGQSPFVFVLYASLALTLLWLRNVRRYLQLVIAAISVVVMGLLMGYAAWSLDEYPSWMSDLGVTEPTLSSCFIVSVPHLLILFIVSIHLRTAKFSTLHAQSLVARIFISHPRLVTRTAVLIPLILALVLFATMPFDFFSAFVLLCFAIQMGFLLEASDFAYTLILRISIVQVFMMVLTVIWVFVSMIPWINSSVIDGLSPANSYILPSEIAVLPNGGYLGKLAIMVSVLVTSSFAIVHAKYIEGPLEATTPSLASKWTQSSGIKKLLIFTCDQLPRALMFIIFLASIYQTTLLNEISEFVVCLFLVVARGWRLVGAVFSVVSIILLLLQYLASFTIVNLYITWEVLDYVGLVWSNAAVARNLVIFLACIVQRNFQQFVRVTYGPEAVRDTYYERLNKYSSVLIAIALVFASIGRSNFYSLIYIVLALIFIARVFLAKESSLSPIVLRIIAIVLWIAITVQLGIRLWFPSVCEWCKTRPSVDWICPDNLSDTQRASCIDDWQRWLNVPSSKDGNTELMDQPAYAKSIAESLGFVGNSYTVPPIEGVLLLWDFFVLWLICVCLQNTRLRSTAAIDHSTRMISETVSGLSHRSLHVKIADSTFRVFVRAWIVVVEILAVLSCFTFRHTVDVFSILFMGLTVWTIWSQEKLLPSRKKPIFANIIVCILLVLLTLIYQIPGFPCKFWYATCESEIVPLTTPAVPRYTIPDIMCVSIQADNEGCENFGTFSWIQVALQIISLVKINVDVVLTPFPMGLGPPLLLLAACLVQLAMYNYSASYAAINEEVFSREISVLRTMRSRRLVVEMNARLLLKNRQVKLGLEASKRKLIRVQESADELLKTLYSRLAEINGPPSLIRQISDGSPAVVPLPPYYHSIPHLSSEYESLCSRGYDENEARAVLSLIDEQDPEEMAVRILEFVQKFGLGDIQESDVYLECRKILGSSGSTNNLRTPTPVPSPTHVVTEYKPIPWYRKAKKKFRDFIASCVDDVAFLTDENAAEPLCLHRRSNGLVTLIIKATYSNSIFFVCLSILLAFVEYNSVFDLVRVLILLLLLPAWPFPSRAAWMLLVAYTFLGLILRAIYQIPIFCGDGNPVWRFQQSSADFVPPCPTAVGIGWDIVIGLQKKFGSSAIPSLSTTGLAAAVWPDLLILAALFTYRSYLCKCGIWDHLEKGIPERDAGAFVVPVAEHWIQKYHESLRRAHENDPMSIDEEMLDDEDLEPLDISEEEGDDATPALDGEESPIGSFIDTNYRPLTLDDRPTLSRYAAQRHMCNEDVFDRLSFSDQYRHRALAGVTQIYKDLRWDAQIHYANHQCVRISRQERDVFNLSAQRSRQNLSFLSSLYVRINPFYAIKVGVDYYAYLCLLGMMMFFHIVFFYSFMTGNSSDFLTSLKKSQLSGGLALLMFFQFILIVLDRAYYIASFRRGGEQQSRLRGGHKTNAPSKQQVLWFFLRVIILFALFCALHAVIMVFLFSSHTSNASVTKAATYEPLIANAALSIYYLEFMLYLLVSVFQIKEGFPRVMRETLRPEKTYHIVTDRFQEWRFLVYRAIPFLDELRILIDWTFTRTSLDLFQYFKLEDAHTYLWQTKREMELRKEMWPAEHRTRIEKIFQGFGFLLLLMVIIIGPVLLFSTLIAPQTVAPLTTASLTLSVTLTTCSGESIGCVEYAGDLNMLESSVSIFSSASPLEITSLSPSESNEYFPNGRTSMDKLTTVQQVTFPPTSDTGDNLADRILELFLLLPSVVRIEYETLLSFHRASADFSYVSGRTDIRMPACACAVGFHQLCDHCLFSDQVDSEENFLAFKNTVSTLIAVAPSPDGVVFPGIFDSVIQLDSSGNVLSTNFGNQTAAVMYNSTTGFGRLSTWNNDCGIPIGAPGGVCSNVTVTSLNRFGNDTTFTFLLPPVYASNTMSGALLSIGIVTVYITIVYAIGKFIRLVFDKESLRVMYLEIPRPDDFLDLAKGAQTARQYKDLPMEFRLYNCLIKVLRSPETLIALGGAEITGYGVGRTDDPPHPDMLTEQEQRSRIRRRRADIYNYQ